MGSFRGRGYQKPAGPIDAAARPGSEEPEEVSMAPEEQDAEDDSAAAVAAEAEDASGIIAGNSRPG